MISLRPHSSHVPVRQRGFRSSRVTGGGPASDPPHRAAPGPETAARTEVGPLAALAVDLDRTILRAGRRLAPAAATAFRAAQRLGLRTILVSGREHRRLKELARGLDGLDGLVAENGGVVEAPLGSSPRIFGRQATAAARRRLQQL